MLTHFAETTSSNSAGFALATVLILIIAAIVLIMVLSLVKIYMKAGKSGWAAIIPIYSTWVLFELTGFPGWLVLLSFIPFVNIVPGVLGLVSTFRLAKLFGKSGGFGVATIFFPYICYPILGFGKAQFVGPYGAGPTNPTGPINPVAPPSGPTPEGVPSFSPQPPIPEPTQIPPAPQPSFTPPETPTNPTDQPPSNGPTPPSVTPPSGPLVQG